MAKRISELPEALLPPNLESLIEIATPTEESPTGYVSESVPLSSIVGNAGGFSNRIYFSGQVEVNIDGECEIQVATYTELVEAVGSFSYEIATASMDVGMSVRNYDNSDYTGSMKASIMYDPNNYSYITYITSGGISSNGLVMMPTYPSSGPWSQISPVVGQVYFNADRNLMFSMKVLSEPSPPSGIHYRGYLDITIQEYIPGT